MPYKPNWLIGIIYSKCPCLVNELGMRGQILVMKVFKKHLLNCFIDLFLIFNDESKPHVKSWRGSPKSFVFICLKRNFLIFELFNIITPGS
jgi:hypothetical protein